MTAAVSTAAAAVESVWLHAAVATSRAAVTAAAVAASRGLVPARFGCGPYLDCTLPGCPLLRYNRGIAGCPLLRYNRGTAGRPLLRSNRRAGCPFDVVLLSRLGLAPAFAYPVANRPSFSWAAHWVWFLPVA